MQQLTAKQKDVLNFLVVYIDEKGYSPSVREIAEHFEMSEVGAWCHLRPLIKKGYIEKAPRIARGIKILREN